MKITYIRMFNKNKRDESMLMKHLRDDNIKKEINSEKRKNTNLWDSEIKEKIKQWSVNNNIKEILTKKLIKKNQAVLIATSLMLVTAGYLNYTNTIKMAEIGDARLVNANVTNGNEESEKITEMYKDEEVIGTSANNEKSILDEKGEKNEETEGISESKKEQEFLEKNQTIDNVIQTSVANNKSPNSEYFTRTKMERDNMYSQMIESYQKLLENNNIEKEQKEVASNEIKNINERKNAIATIENLIKIKEIEDVVILINGNSINVVVKSKENLETTKIAQIQNIVSRELNSEIADIHITTHE